MTQKFDHLVHFTRSPEDAAERFTSLGFNTFQGGKHPNWGTYNSLCYFHNLGYIEWIGFTDFEVAKASDNVLIQQIVEDSEIGEGFTTLAFRTDDISCLKESLNQRGFETVGPVPGNRKREDGTLLSWSMLFIKGEFRYPFFIQWGQSDDERKRELHDTFQHKNGEPVISYVGFGVENVQEAVSNYCSLFNLNPSVVEHLEDYHKISIGGISLHFYDGESKRPLVCGISGVATEKFVTINGGNYKFDNRKG